MPEILPCPFCGGEAKVINDSVYCMNCWANVKGTYPEQAIRNWNTRV